MEKVCKLCYCSKYGQLAQRLCRKSADNNDDWDELEDSCLDCGYWTETEVQMDTFKVKCKKDYVEFKVGEEVEACVSWDMLVVGGYMTSIDEFREHFED